MTKQALDPRISAALQLGLLGAGGGLAFQGVRKMLQGREDQEENGSPSLLRGALTGGLLGAAGGGGLAHLLGLHEGGAPSSSFGSPSQGLGADLAGAAPKPSPASLNPNSLMAALQDNEPFTMGSRGGELSQAFSGGMRAPSAFQPGKEGLPSSVSITDLADLVERQPGWRTPTFQTPTWWTPGYKAPRV